MRRPLYALIFAGVLIAGCNSEKKTDETRAGDQAKGKPGTEGVVPAEHSVQMRGMYVYMADAALFVDCATGKKYPVAMEGDNIALERAYLEAELPAGQPLLVVVRATVDMRPPMEGEGVVETLIVKSLEKTSPGEDCDLGVTDEAVENIIWRLVAFADGPVELGPKQRAPDLRLQSSDHMAQGFAGCNRFNAEYDIEDGALTLGPVAMTKKLCETGIDLEDRFGEMLTAVRSYRVTGGELELHGEEGLLARFVELQQEEIR